MPTKTRITIEGRNQSGKAFANVRSDLTKTENASKRATSNVSNNFKQFGNSLDSVSGKLGPISGLVSGVGKALTGPAGLVAAFGSATTGVAALTNSVIRNASQLQISANRTGLYASQVKVLERAAIGVGEDLETVNGLFETFNERIEEAEIGTGEGAAVFKELSIALKGANGEVRPSIDLFIELAQKLNSMDDRARAAAISTRLLSADGFRLITEITPEVIASLIDVDHELNNQIKSADELRRSWKSFSDGVSDSVSEAILPAVPEIKALSDELLGVGNTIKEATGPALSGFINLVADFIGNDYRSKGALADMVFMLRSIDDLINTTLATGFRNLIDIANVFIGLPFRGFQGSIDYFDNRNPSRAVTESIQQRLNLGRAGQIGFGNSPQPGLSLPPSAANIPTGGGGGGGGGGGSVRPDYSGSGSGGGGRTPAQEKADRERQRAQDEYAKAVVDLNERQISFLDSILEKNKENGEVTVAGYNSAIEAAEAIAEKSKERTAEAINFAKVVQDNNSKRTAAEIALNDQVKRFTNEQQRQFLDNIIERRGGIESLKEADLLYLADVAKAIADNAKDRLDENTNFYKQQAEEEERLRVQRAENTEALRNDIQGAVKGFITGTKSFGDALKGIRDGILDRIVDKISGNIADSILSGFTKTGNHAGNIFTSLAQGLPKLFSPFFQFLGQGFSNVGKFVGNLFSNLLKGLGNSLNGILRGFSGAFNNLIGGVGKALSGLLGGIGGGAGAGLAVGNLGIGSGIAAIGGPLGTSTGALSAGLGSLLPAIPVIGGLAFIASQAFRRRSPAGDQRVATLNSLAGRDITSFTQFTAPEIAAILHASRQRSATQAISLSRQRSNIDGNAHRRRQYEEALANRQDNLRSDIDRYLQAYGIGGNTLQSARELLRQRGLYGSGEAGRPTVVINVANGDPNAIAQTVREVLYEERLAGGINA